MTKWLRFALAMAAATVVAWACAKLECGAEGPTREPPFDPMEWARGDA